MFLLGLTGSIAMGKSTASHAFRCFGVPVFDADATVHRLFAPGGAVVAPVLAAFPDCMGTDGGVDRAALGRLVFDDPGALARLERIVHPLVRAEQGRFLGRAAAAGQRLVVLDIPLLFETGGDRQVDAVAVVSAPPFLQMQRALRRPGMTVARLAAIQARQMPDRAKRRRADFIIGSGLDRRWALVAVGRIVAAVRARRGRAWPSRWRRAISTQTLR